MIRRRAEHERGRRALRVRVVHALRRQIRAHRRVHREHDAVGRRAQRVAREERGRRIRRLAQRDGLLLLVAHVVDPRARARQPVLARENAEVRARELHAVQRVVERVAAHGPRVDRERALLLVVLILRGLQARGGGLHLRRGDVERLAARLCPELVEQRLRGVGLRGELRGGGALHRVVDREKRVARLHRVALAHEDPRDRARDLRIQVHVRTGGLIALDDARRIDAARIRVRRGLEHGRLRRLLDAVDPRGREAREKPDDRGDEDDPLPHRPPPRSIAVSLPSSIRRMRSA